MVTATTAPEFLELAAREEHGRRRYYQWCEHTYTPRDSEAPMLGWPELLLIFIIVILLFGAGRLASVGRGLGEGIANFRDGLNKGRDDKALEEKKNT